MKARRRCGLRRRSLNLRDPLNLAHLPRILVEPLLHPSELTVDDGGVVELWRDGPGHQRRFQGWKPTLREPLFLKNSLADRIELLRHSSVHVSGHSGTAKLWHDGPAQRRDPR